MNLAVRRGLQDREARKANLLLILSDFLKRDGSPNYSCI